MRHVTPTFSKASSSRLGIKLGLRAVPGPVIGSMLLLLASLSSGCSQHALRPPEEVVKHARHDAREKQEVERSTLPYPEHVAPPPAYGNKVVLAEKATKGASF